MAATYPEGVDMAAAIAAGFVLDRRDAVPALIGRHEDFLFVTGLAGTARDIAALTHDGAHIYTMAGAMGGPAVWGSASRWRGPTSACWWRLATASS